MLHVGELFLCYCKGYIFMSHNSTDFFGFPKFGTLSVEGRMVTFAVNAHRGCRTYFAFWVLVVGTSQAFLNCFANFTNMAESAAFKALSNLWDEGFQVQSRSPNINEFW